MKSGLVALAALVLSMLLIPLHSASAATQVTFCNMPNTTALPGNLRFALDQGGTVTFACNGTMNLGNTYTITKNTTIDGAGHTITISGESAYRLFYVPQGVTLTIKNLTLTGGNSTGFFNQFNNFGDGGAILNFGKVVLKNANIQKSIALKGGAIYTGSDGIATVENSIFASNKTLQGSHWNQNNGGAIYVEDGSLDVNSSTFVGNSAYFGGAIANDQGRVNINDSTFKDNFTQPTVNSRSDSEGGTEMVNDATGASGGAISSNAQINIGSSFFDTNTASYAGGALYIHGGILQNNTFTLNKAKGQNGGAIANSGTLHSYYSTFDGNQALNGEGGAVYSGLQTELRLEGSTFKNNNAGPNGGAVTSRGGELSLWGDLFYSNTATSFGGGVYSTAKTTNLINSTLSNNFASKGGNLAVEKDVIAAVLNDTFSNDKVNGSSSIYSNGFIALKNTIVSNYLNNATNCAGSNIWDGGNNLQFPKTSCGATIPVKDAKLMPLGNYGGPTMAMKLGAGSPAIDAGNAAVCAGPLVNNLDQRGYDRPTDGNADGVKACDIGAFENNAIAYGGK